MLHKCESRSTTEVAHEVPRANGITEYDNRHDDTCLRLIDAGRDGVGKDEMARLTLGIDPGKEPEHARKGVDRRTAVWRNRKVAIALCHPRLTSSDRPDQHGISKRLQAAVSVLSGRNTE